MTQSDIDKFAQQQGYSKAEYLCEWREFQCYEPIIGDGTQPSFIGLPLLVLVDRNDNIRMSTSAEAMQQLRETNSK